MSSTWKRLIPTSSRSLLRNQSCRYNGKCLQTMSKTLFQQTKYATQTRAFTQSVIRPVSFKNIFAMKEHAQENPVLYDQDHLFHILSQSPIPELRDRANIVKKYGVCPVCEALGENTEHKPAYDCPDCGYPTHCSEKHYYMGLAEHKEHHCDILRQINEDDHDLRSGRPMREFEFPSTQGFDETVNMANWDMFFYTRSFPSMDSDRSMRHVSKLLTYPMSIGQLLHESCPYKYGEQITKEGMRSIAALRTILYPGDRLTNGASPAFNTETINIYILGARAEATLPSHIWLQLSYLFPATPFHLHFVGPDALAPKQKPHTESVHERLIFTYNNAMYHDYHETIEKFDPFTDLFFLFSPGIGYPDARPSWKPSIAKALETKCPIFITGFSEADIMNDIKAVEQDHANEFDWLLKPTVNEFRSLKRDVNLMDLRQTAFANHSIWGIRGKRYDVVHDPAHSD